MVFQIIVWFLWVTGTKTRFLISEPVLVNTNVTPFRFRVRFDGAVGSSGFTTVCFITWSSCTGVGSGTVPEYMWGACQTARRVWDVPLSSVSRPFALRLFLVLSVPAAPFAGNSLGMVKSAYLVAGITKDYLNASSGKEALIMAVSEPGFVGGGNAPYIPLGAVIFWYVFATNYAWICAVIFLRFYQ